MRRLNRRDERGAIAVLVAILMVVLLGCAAIAVDVGALWFDKKQLQNGADAGALAIATNCAKGACGAYATTATSYAVDNKLDPVASGTVGGVVDPVTELPGTVTESTGTVTVKTTATRDNLFAPIFGLSQSQSRVSARATAVWGAIGGGNTIPLTIPACAYDPTKLDDPTQFVILEIKGPSTGSGAAPCTPSGTPHVIAGGFQWLLPDASCGVLTTYDNKATSKPGADSPAPTCPDATLQAILQHGPVLIPMFDLAGSTGAHGWYHIVGYATFQPTAWNLNNTVNQPSWQGASSLWLKGYFMTTVDSGGNPINPSATDFATKSVRLSG